MNKKQKQQFIAWLKESFNKGFKWFKNQKKKTKQDLKHNYTANPFEPCKDCIIPAVPAEFKLQPGQSFSANLIDIQGEKLYKENCLGNTEQYGDIPIITAYLDEGYVAHIGQGNIEVIRKSFAGNPLVPNPGPGDGKRDRHGTWCTGIIIDSSGPTLCSLSGKVKKHYSYKVMDGGMGTFDQLNAGLQDLLELSDSEFPNFIGMSIGMLLDENSKNNSDVVLCRELLAKVKQRGCLIFASAGNLGQYAKNGNDQSWVTFPASDPNVEAIGNLNWADVADSTSSPGPEVILCGNGVNVVSWREDGVGYLLMTGTSMATPSVMSACIGICTKMVKRKQTTVKKFIAEFPQNIIDAGYVKDVMMPGRDRLTGFGQVGIWVV